MDERALNIPDEGKRLNPWEMTENQNIVINSARNIGCQVRAAVCDSLVHALTLIPSCLLQVVNIHASDLIKCVEDGKQHLVLGLIWQVVKVQLLSQVSLREVPQLVSASTCHVHPPQHSHLRVCLCGACWGV